MESEEEDKAIEKVVDRLADRFTDIGRDRIEELVDDESEALAENPVRDFVPVLIEHAATDRLREESTTGPLSERQLEGEAED